jgi:hypothetical protein
LQFTYPWASIKDAQATGEAFSPQKRTSSTSKNENSVLFSIFLGHFSLLDPDPEAQINADPCGSGSKTLEKTMFSLEKKKIHFKKLKHLFMFKT